MIQVLMILIPVVLLSLFLAGGLAPQFPQKVEDFRDAGPATEIVIPTPSPGKQLQIRPFRVAVGSPAPCEDGNVAVNLLLDTSGSMKQPIAKLQALQSGVKDFIGRLTTDDAVAIQIFSSPGDVTDQTRTLVCPDAACPVIAPRLVSETFDTSAIDNMYANGATYMKDSFQIARPIVDQLVDSYPNHRHIMIFFSDGKPETDTSNGYAVSQEPIAEANAIKDSDVRLITVGLGLDDRTRNLMTRIASTPTDKNAYFAATPDDISRIYADISESICADN